MTSRALLHPIWWGALVALIVNDHWLKSAGVLPAGVTGKLSDVAGLLLAPTLCAVVVRARSRRGVVGCHAAVGLLFAALKTIPAASVFAVRAAALFGLRWQIVCDPTDLFALPALGLSILVFSEQPTGQRILRAHQRLLGAVGLVVGLVATVATSRAPSRVAAVGQPAAGTLAVRSGARLFLLDPLTGHTKSRLTLGDADFSSNQDWVLFWPGGRRLRAWNLAESRLVWERPFPIDGCTARAEVQHVLIVCPGRVASWQLSDGAERWATAATLRACSAEIVLTEREGRLYAVSADTGRELGSRPSDFDDLCLSQGILFGVARQRLFALDPRNAEVLAERDLEDTRPTRILCPSSSTLPRGPASQPPNVVEPGAPLLLGYDSAIHAYDPRTLGLLWRYPATGQRGPREGTLVVATRRVVVVRGYAEYYGIDAANGNLVWPKGKPQASRAPMVVVEEFFGETMAFDALTGRELWRRDLDQEP